MRWLCLETGLLEHLKGGCVCRLRHAILYFPRQDMTEHGNMATTTGVGNKVNLDRAFPVLPPALTRWSGMNPGDNHPDS